MFKFIGNVTGKAIPGNVIYIKKEGSFDFVPSRNSDITILLGYIHMGVDSETMIVQQVWGLSPFEGWNKKALSVPSFSEGELLIIGDLQPGLTYRIDGSEKWAAKYDIQTGWVCIGESELTKNDEVIKFTDMTIAVVNNGELKSLWLKPKIE